VKWVYRCPGCGAEYAIEPGRYLCGPCSAGNTSGMPLGGVLDCAFDPDEAKWELSGGDLHGLPELSLLLPAETRYFPPLPVGNTPMWEAPRLRSELGFPGLWLKDDSCEPSGSYKDRASFLVAAFAKKHGLSEVALASTGNAASSMACVGAAAGLRVTVFLPKSAPVAKRIQVLQYGATLREIEGNYDLAFDTCMEYTDKTGVLSRNTAYNPLTIEGKKTGALEIVRDLRRAGIRQPDHVFVPTGDGVIVSGVLKGFEDLLALGEIDRVPKVWAAQAEGSSAIARALETGSLEFRPSATIADSISVDAPRNGLFALAKLKKHGGGGVMVSDEEILAAQLLCSSRAGLFAEPSSACALAGFMKARPSLGAGETAVVMLTGSGLKDIKSAAKALEYAL
jgi:threonine synthase